MKQIIIEPGKPPQFVGNWTNGEVRAAMMSILQWLDSLPLFIEQTSEVNNNG